MYQGSPGGTTGRTRMCPGSLGRTTGRKGSCPPWTGGWSPCRNIGSPDRKSGSHGIASGRAGSPGVRDRRPGSPVAGLCKEVVLIQR